MLTDNINDVSDSPTIANFEQLVDNLNSITDPSVPLWASTLIDCFKGLIEQLKVVNNTVNKVDELKSLYSVQKIVTDNLAADNERLRNDLQKLTLRVDDQEQRQRNNCLILHGVEERADEKTDDIIINVIKNDLGLDISHDDIQRSHRLGPKTTKPRYES